MLKSTISMICTLIAVLLLSSCRSIGSDHAPIDNSDIQTLSDCSLIGQHIEITERKLASFKKEKGYSDAGNAVTVGGAILALNPFLLLDIDRQGNYAEVIKSYKERAAALHELQDRLCGHEIEGGTPSEQVSVVETGEVLRP